MSILFISFYLNLYFFFHFQLHLDEEKIVNDIIGKMISSLYDYINSEEFSNMILQTEPKLETFYKMQIDGQIRDRIEKATKIWLEENAPKIVKTEFDILIQDITDKYEKMSNICRQFEGIAEFNNTFKEEEFVMTLASGIAWVSNKFIWSVFLGAVAVIVISEISVLYTLAVGALMITRQFIKVDKIIHDSFKNRVKSMNKEKLQTLLHKKFEKGLRECHRHVFTILLPSEIRNMSYSVDLLKKNQIRMEKKQNHFKRLLTEMVRCQNDVDKIITAVPRV